MKHFGIIFCIIFGIVAFANLRFVFAKVPPTEKIIFLTLDADMSQGMAKKYAAHAVEQWYDPRIIAYLEHENIPTTFFVSGLFAETYPDVIRSLAANPLFSIQNHSYDESGFTPHCYWLHALQTTQEKTDQIEKTQKILEKFTGKPPRYFRYPGLCAGKGDDAIVQKLGLTLNEGTIIAADPFNRHTQRIVARVLTHLKNNGVIVMHVGGPNAPRSYDALQQIIPAIRKQGFTFVKL